MQFSSYLLGFIRNNQNPSGPRHRETSPGACSLARWFIADTPQSRPLLLGPPCNSLVGLTTRNPPKWAVATGIFNLSAIHSSISHHLNSPYLPSCQPLSLKQNRRAHVEGHAFPRLCRRLFRVRAASQGPSMKVQVLSHSQACLNFHFCSPVLFSLFRSFWAFQAFHSFRLAGVIIFHFLIIVKAFLPN